MEKIKDFVFIAVAYITVCGILYHLFYWGAFNLNGFSFVTVSNIITAALYPVVVTNYTVIAALIVLSCIVAIFLEKGHYTRIRNTPVRKLIYIRIEGLILMAVIPVIFYFATKSITVFASFQAVLLVAYFFFFFDITFISNKFDNKYISGFILVSFMYLPISCVLSGILTAKKIRDNIEYHYFIRDNTFSKDTLKLLGSSDNMFLFSDMKNEKIFYIKSDSLTMRFKQGLDSFKSYKF